MESHHNLSLSLQPGYHGTSWHRAYPNVKVDICEL